MTTIVQLTRILASGTALAFVALALLFLRGPRTTREHEHPLGSFAEDPAWQVRTHLLYGSMYLLAAGVAFMATPFGAAGWGNVATAAGVLGCILFAQTMWFQTGNLRDLAEQYRKEAPPVSHRALEYVWQHTQFATWGGPLEALPTFLVGVWALLSGIALREAHPIAGIVGILEGVLDLWKVADWWLQTFWCLERRPLRSDAIGYAGMLLFPVWVLLLAWSA